MRGRSKTESSREHGSAGRNAAAGRSVEAAPGTAPVFNPRGIGSNVALAAAAAVVPLVIVGVAGIKAILGLKKSRR